MDSPRAGVDPIEVTAWIKENLGSILWKGRGFPLHTRGRNRLWCPPELSSVYWGFFLWGLSHSGVNTIIQFHLLPRFCTYCIYIYLITCKIQIVHTDNRLITVDCDWQTTDPSSRQRERPTSTRLQMSDSNKDLVLSPRWVLYSKIDWPTDRRS
jgi:hypothetical protein